MQQPYDEVRLSFAVLDYWELSIHDEFSRKLLVNFKARAVELHQDYVTVEWVVYDNIYYLSYTSR